MLAACERLRIKRKLFPKTSTTWQIWSINTKSFHANRSHSQIKVSNLKNGSMNVVKHQLRRIISNLRKLNLKKYCRFIFSENFSSSDNSNNILTWGLDARHIYCPWVAFEIPCNTNVWFAIIIPRDDCSCLSCNQERHHTMILLCLFVSIFPLI